MVIENQNGLLAMVTIGEINIWQWKWRYFEGKSLKHPSLCKDLLKVSFAVSFKNPLKGGAFRKIDSYHQTVSKQVIEYTSRHHYVKILSYFQNETQIQKCETLMP